MCVRLISGPRTGRSSDLQAVWGMRGIDQAQSRAEISGESVQLLTYHSDVITATTYDDISSCVGFRRRAQTQFGMRSQ